MPFGAHRGCQDFPGLVAFRLSQFEIEHLSKLCRTVRRFARAPIVRGSTHVSPCERSRVAKTKILNRNRRRCVRVYLTHTKPPKSSRAVCSLVPLCAQRTPLHSCDVDRRLVLSGRALAAEKAHRKWLHANGRTLYCKRSTFACVKHQIEEVNMPCIVDN